MSTHEALQGKMDKKIVEIKKKMQDQLNLDVAT
jgi:hypothetical protein